MRSPTLWTARAIFLTFMTWLRVWFLPGHTRGRITIGPSEHRGSPATAAAHACCAGDEAGPAERSLPTSKDRANCAVCFWGAGLLTTPPVVLDLLHAERSFEQAAVYHAQVRREALRLNHFGRDPPPAATPLCVV